VVESDDPRLEALGQSVARLEERVRRLEELLPPALAAEEPETELEAEPGVGERWLDLALIGRSILVLGLGYLLRAGTDLAVVPDAVGAGAGLALALGLVALADRAGARGRRVSAVLHGMTALVIALPLIGELVVRFHLVGPAVAAALALAFAVLTLAVAARRSLVPLAWVTSVATLTAALGLAAVTATALPFAALLVALVAATGWFGHALGQRFLVWPVALVADAVTFGVGAMALWGRRGTSSWGAAAVGVGLFLISSGGTLVGAVRDRSGPTVWAKLQAAIAFLAGLAVALRLAAGLDGGELLGVLTLGLGLGIIVIALRFFPSRAGRALNFFTSLGLAVVLTALAVLVPTPGALALLYLASAGALFAIGRRRLGALSELQILATILAATAVSGLARTLATALAAAPADIQGPGLVAVVVAASTVAFAVALPEPPEGAARLERAAKIGALALAAVGVVGVIDWAAFAQLHPSAAAAAAFRTALLSLAAIALALAGRTAALRSAGVLVYPVLALTAIKICVEDLRIGVAAGLFASLASFGVALIVAPRLRSGARA